MIDSDTATVVFAYAALIVGLVVLLCAGLCIVAVLGQPKVDNDEEYL